MAEYIEREAVLKLFDKVGCYLNPKCLERQKEDIEKLPTADVVPVVRCKDCEHFNIEENGFNWCDFHSYDELIECKENDYCSYGERRRDE